MDFSVVWLKMVEMWMRFFLSDDLMGGKRVEWSFTRRAEVRYFAAAIIVSSRVAAVIL